MLRKNQFIGGAIPYPPIEKLGLIGDRRTAALIAADGSLCWLCLPNYDGRVVFGALLDFDRGGYWRFGPQRSIYGRQHYEDDSVVLATVWEADGNGLELVDFMPSPEEKRPVGEETRRTIIRRLRCTTGQIDCHLTLEPRDDFDAPFTGTQIDANTVRFVGSTTFDLWCSLPFASDKHAVRAEFPLSAGQEVWCALEAQSTKKSESTKRRWTVDLGYDAKARTEQFWRDWLTRIDFCGSRREQVRRSALSVHLLTFAPSGAVIAAPTSSLPERIGGSRNYDYRFTWIRDASLSIGLLSKLGSTVDAKRFLNWIVGLRPGKSMPLQDLYTIDGGEETPLVKRTDLYGYRGSRPVEFGNAAAPLFEIGSFGFLADSALTYLHHRGEWEPAFTELIRRIADFTALHWQRPGSGIWEIKPEQQFVSSKILSWATIDRALKICEITGEKKPDAWIAALDDIRIDVMRNGWSEELGSFRQRYGTDSLDAALLLIPILGFLPMDHPRVQATVEQVAARLEVNGFLHRFVAKELPNQGVQPLGEEEGAFLMCSFWLAQIYALCGEIEKAQDILVRAETIAGPTTLFAEAIDARRNEFLGNMPLLFSQVEYAKAAIALTEAQRRAAVPETCRRHE